MGYSVHRKLKFEKLYVYIYTPEYIIYVQETSCVCFSHLRRSFDPSTSSTPVLECPYWFNSNVKSTRHYLTLEFHLTPLSFAFNRQSSARTSIMPHGFCTRTCIVLGTQADLFVVSWKTSWFCTVRYFLTVRCGSVRLTVGFATSEKRTVPQSRISFFFEPHETAA